MAEIRYIILRDYGYDGLGIWYANGVGDDPIPSFDSEEVAIEFAKEHGLISPKRRRDESAIIAVEIPDWEPRPGEMHSVDRAFYDLAIKERDFERRRVDRLLKELDGRDS